MLYELIKANRELLLLRSANLSAQSGEQSNLQAALLGRVSVFFDQLTDTLHIEHATPNEKGKPSARTSGSALAVKMFAAAYGHHGVLQDSNLAVDALVRNYGNVCQTITGYAVEVDAPIEVAEFNTLNWCLDEAISQAAIAIEFTMPAPQDAGNINAARLKYDGRLDDMAKMTNHIEFISNTVTAMRTGQVGLDGATGTLLDESLNAMRDLVQRGIDQRI